MKKIFKCNYCGNIVEQLHVGGGTLVCCGQPMEELKENSSREYAEKHAPFIDGNKVSVGKIEHPMEETHYIEWIEATNEKETAKVFLSTTEKPEAEFSFKPTKARMFCNIHGLWVSS
jgi:superoxide reductase